MNDQKRIIGTEMEWSLEGWRQPDQPASCEYLLACLKRNMRPEVSSLKDFLSNGARLYQDVGDHIEYATAESDSLSGAVLGELAGEHLMFEALKRAVELKQLSHYELRKRVIDDQGTTWGYHESYGCQRGNLDIKPANLALLGLHLATRNLYCGAGSVRPSTAKQWPSRFTIAQKSLELYWDFHRGTVHHDKPLVNLRDEPLTGDENLARVHVTSGDPNMSPWATKIKLGTTSIVLRLIEAGISLPELEVRTGSLQRIALQVATDLSLKQTVKLGSGQSIRPLEIQQELLQAAIALDRRIDFPAEDKQVLVDWQLACDDLETDYRRLRDRADWVAKYLLLDKYRAKHDYNWSDQAMRDADLKWDSFGSFGIGLKLRDGLWQKYMPSEQLIAERSVLPPATTRANLRGRFVKHFANRPKINAVVSWNHLLIQGSDWKVDLSDPLRTDNQELDDLLSHYPKRANARQRQRQLMPSRTLPALPAAVFREAIASA